jgi:DNA polymerase III sliding clamp (beta) subunit (PCNA family)
MEHWKEKELREYRDIPYTVVGYTSIPNHFDITLEAKGLKEIVKKMNDEDLLRIEVYSNHKHPTFKIIKPKKEAIKE